MNKKYNIGLSLLRLIMCFMVVLCHCWNAEDTQGILSFFQWMRGFAVPVFMMMSFILVQKSLVIHDGKKIIRRFERLLIPQFGWTLIYWIALYINSVLLQKQFDIGISDVVWQMFLGHSPKLNATMWYQVDLIFLTFLFLVIIVIFKRNYEVILWILSIVALFIQYSQINMIFESWRYEVKYPIGRLAEMLPIAVAGFMISDSELLEKLINKRLVVILASISMIWLDKNYGFFSPVSGYGYSGIRMIVIAMSFIALFYVIPFEKVNGKMKCAISFLTKYTMGIYCMHRLISTFLAEIISNFKIGITISSFSYCILVYIVCFVCAWIGDILLGKTKLKVLFD